MVVVRTMELFSFLEPKAGQPLPTFQPPPIGGFHLHPPPPPPLQQQHQASYPLAGQQQWLPPPPPTQQQQQASEPLQQHQQQRPRQEQQQAGEGITFNFNRRRVAGRGGDVEVRVWLTFEESVRGCIRELRFRALVPCGACRGRGLLSLLEAGLVRSRDELTPCAHCHGTGTYSRRSALLTINSTCCHCNGHGYPLDQPCVQCSHGRLSDEKVLHIEVPQGVMHDMRMVYSGQGDAGEFGGDSGDLVVVFGVEESSLFQRDGDDVLSEVNVSYFEAALGATVLIRGIYGNEIPLPIPPGTQPDTLLCLKGEGFLSVCATPAPPEQDQAPSSSLHPSSSVGEVGGVPSSSYASSAPPTQPPPPGEQAAFPHYQYRRRRRRSSYQPPPDNGEKPTYRTINRTDYFNSLLQKSNFFSSTFLQQGGSGLASPFSLFRDENEGASSTSSSSSSSSASASSVLPNRVGTGVSSQWVSAAGSEGNSEDDLLDGHDAGSSAASAHSLDDDAGRESSVGFEDHRQRCHLEARRRGVSANPAGTGDNGDLHEQQPQRAPRGLKRPRPVREAGGMSTTDAVEEEEQESDDDGAGMKTTTTTMMAKEVEEEQEEQEGAPLPAPLLHEQQQQQEEEVVNGYSPEAEAERRVVGGGMASADAEDEHDAGSQGLEIRHTVVRTEGPWPPFDEVFHKAKEEEREEHASLDAIDIDTSWMPLDEHHDDHKGSAVADSVLVADLPLAPLLPRHRAQAQESPVPVVAAPSPPTSSPSSMAAAGQQEQQEQQRRGNMYIRVKVGVPQALDPRQVHLLAALHRQWAASSATGDA